MKSKFYILVLLSLSLIIFVGCEKDPASTPGVIVPQTDLVNVAAQGATVSIEVKNVANWFVSSDGLWCRPQVSFGQGNAVIQFDVEANLLTKARTTNIRFVNGEQVENIKITQLAGDGSEHHYKLPVIFHLIESPKSEAKFIIKNGYAAELIREVNKLFKGKLGGVDVNLEFVMAEKDPKGNTLTEPGVERVLWGGTYPVGVDYLMSSKNNTFKPMLWDANKYINIFMCEFIEKGIAGVAHLPIMTNSYELPGTNSVNASYLTLDNLDFTFCVSFNSTAAYQRHGETTFNSNDFVSTVAHELAHHLGLHHVFAEKNGVMLNDWTDSDYCMDTPTYNRLDYQKWHDNYVNTTSELKLAELLTRTAADGSQFRSDNIMDYYWSLGDMITKNQFDRMRYVLTYAVLLPGAKIRASDSKITKTVMTDVEPLWVE